MPVKASRQPAVPKLMTDTQFERVLTLSARLSLLLLGTLALVIALALGKVILAPIALAIVVGLMFGHVVIVRFVAGLPAALAAA